MNCATGAFNSNQSPFEYKQYRSSLLKFKYPTSADFCLSYSSPRTLCCHLKVSLSSLFACLCINPVGHGWWTWNICWSTIIIIIITVHVLYSDVPSLPQNNTHNYIYLWDLSCIEDIPLICIILVLEKDEAGRQTDREYYTLGRVVYIFDGSKVRASLCSPHGQEYLFHYARGLPLLLNI